MHAIRQFISVFFFALVNVAVLAAPMNELIARHNRPHSSSGSPPTSNVENHYAAPAGMSDGGSVHRTSAPHTEDDHDLLGLGKVPQLFSGFTGNAGSGGRSNSVAAKSHHGAGRSGSTNVVNTYSGPGGRAPGGGVFDDHKPALIEAFNDNAGPAGLASSGN